MTHAKPRSWAWASYGTPHAYLDEVRKVIRSDTCRGIDIDLLADMSPTRHSATRSFSSKFEELFGPAPRARQRSSASRRREGRRYADIAASLQAVAEDCVVDLATSPAGQDGAERSLHRRAASRSIPVINARLTTRTKFKRVFVHPAPGDDGWRGRRGAVGVERTAVKSKRGAPPQEAGSRPVMVGLRHRPAARRSPDPPHTCLDGDDRLIDSVVGDLVDGGKVAGWFEGRFEWGFRARSVTARSSAIRASPA